jgi:hypothetical protein
VCIKPKSDGQDTSCIRDDVTQHINPAKLQVGVSNVRQNRQGTVTIECTDVASAKSLVKEMTETLGEKYVSEITPKLLPRLKIMNLNQDDKAFDICESIMSQNNLTPESKHFSLKVITTVKRKSGSSFVVIETDPATRLRLLAEGKVNVHWRRHRVYDHVNITQCYKCAGIKHTARDCTRDQVCMKCAGSHDAHNCVATELKCVNCSRHPHRPQSTNPTNTNHDARNSECPFIQRATDQLRSRIAYSVQ